MRQLSAAQIKRRLKGKKITPPSLEPRDGTYTRSVYDLFMRSPGKPVEFKVGKSKIIIRTLQDTYGLDIRRLKQGHKESKSLWVLAGEWFGPVYVDYTQASEEHMEMLLNARYALQDVEHAKNVLPAGVHVLSKDSIDILARVAEKGKKIAEKHLKREA